MRCAKVLDPESLYRMEAFWEGCIDTVQQKKSSAHVSTPMILNTKVSSLVQHSKEHNCTKITLKISQLDADGTLHVNETIMVFNGHGMQVSITNSRPTYRLVMTT